jgi:hypothetical protein
VSTGKLSVGKTKGGQGRNDGRRVASKRKAATLTTLQWNLEAYPWEIMGQLDEAVRGFFRVLDIMVSEMLGVLPDDVADNAESNGCLYIWEEVETKRQLRDTKRDYIRLGNPPLTVIFEAETPLILHDTRAAITGWLAGGPLLSAPGTTAEMMCSAHHFAFTMITSAPLRVKRQNQTMSDHERALLLDQSVCKIEIVARDEADAPAIVKSDRYGIYFPQDSETGKSRDYNTRFIEIQEIGRADQTTIRVTVGENLELLNQAYSERLGVGNKRGKSTN